ncbi:MAG: translation initiation factor eIF-1A [Thermoplasmata archaeon]|nr:translation initiation factor eIF-1A [Thermoplasmata archaeon]OYT50406.1 MAG: translation initiation factor eIF-1A [Thermoplasmatales archaeon ex4484_36]HDD60460.1 translation initiation factor eIF-1A [Euryarchaeota archaeon]RLF55887.1 MAG: translation initiation factor eIF-1A [Thermoplasmata archaeon]RLF70020.1 MAG: translation initiation factor eIF-1A [Thermoplasmata archaeon]
MDQDDEETTIEMKTRTEKGEEEVIRVKLPDRKKGEMFAVVDQALGGARMRVICQDGKVRLGRVKGKYKKRMWIRVGDLLIVQPWEFQDEKCDIIYRYTNTQAMNLKRRGFLPTHLASLL